MMPSLNHKASQNQLMMDKFKEHLLETSRKILSVPIEVSLLS